MAGQRLRRENFKDAQIARRVLDELLNAVIAAFVMLHHAHQLLQAAFAQPLLHALHPLRRVEHRRRYGTNDHNGIRATPVGLFNRNSVADAAVLIADTVKINTHAIETRNGAGRFDHRQPVFARRCKIVGGVVITAAGAHQEFTTIDQQLFSRVHRQWHIFGGFIHQPVEIDKMPATHKAQGIKEVRTGGITGDNASRVTRLAANKGREILCTRRSADKQVKRIETRTLKFVQHARGENPALPPAFTDQRNLAGFVRFVRQRFNIAKRDRYSVSQRLPLSEQAAKSMGLTSEHTLSFSVRCFSNKIPEIKSLLSVNHMRFDSVRLNLRQESSQCLFFLSECQSRLRPVNRLTRNRMIPTTKTIFAAQAAVPARPPKPSAAAINAMIRNIMPQRNISFSFTLFNFCPIHMVYPISRASLSFKPFYFGFLKPDVAG